MNPCDLTAIEARDAIRRRDLSPVDYARALIERVERVDHAVNAVVAADFDRVLDDAREAEAALASGAELPPLHGLVFAVKDMIDVAGLPTTFGSPLFAENVATRDDPIVAAMRRAGAIPLGKTNVPEWSAGGNTRNVVYGVTANPYDLAKTCAGSSGGSAVALACGMAPLATGSDTGGSLRNPAAFCSVVGFRPSPGVVPGGDRGIAALPLPTSGPMARTVADAGLMLGILARPDRRDPYTAVIDGRTLWAPERFASPGRVDLATLKIAVTEDFGFAPTEAIVRSAFRRAVAAISPALGAVDETSPDCSGADDIFSVLRAVMFLGSHHRRVVETPDRVGPNVTANVAEGLALDAVAIADALTRQSAYYRAWQSFFETTDYILCPAVTVSPRPWRELYPAEIDGRPTRSYYHWLAMAYAATLAGHPAITIPCGRDALGMPFGLQIVGRRHDDAGVLAVAAELERVIAGTSGLEPPQPDLAALENAPPLKDAEGFRDFG
ncbi:amidase [Jiella sonneratiae]|uniref:Amidase n=1 Tax=Jiella sonneratiae TaxID=2816856 RepID=A0ABS3J7A0_9HYPH|nr:amidase family protein [Jiella sonneratiae]MBO0904987.1 amidase [Jiella sonneratiae]